MKDHSETAAIERGKVKLAFDNADDNLNQSNNNQVDTDGGDGTVAANRHGKGGQMQRGAGGNESPHDEPGTQGLQT